MFLNKIDLFAEKLPRSPLGDYFPDYNGGDDYDAACNYLLHRFVSLNQSAATKQIYAHYTCATDTQQIKCACITVPAIVMPSTDCSIDASSLFVQSSPRSVAPLSACRHIDVASRPSCAVA